MSVLMSPVVMCPLSVLDNWAAEFDRFSPQITVLKYSGNKGERKELRLSIIDSIRKQAKEVRRRCALPRADLASNGTTRNCLLKSSS